jgi:hypothetical protein
MGDTSPQTGRGMTGNSGDKSFETDNETTTHCNRELRVGTSLTGPGGCGESECAASGLGGHLLYVRVWGPASPQPHECSSGGDARPGTPWGKLPRLPGAFPLRFPALSSPPAR